MNTYAEHQVTLLSPPAAALRLHRTRPRSPALLLRHLQVVIDTDKTTYSLRLQTQDQLDHMVGHINYALSRVFNNSIYA